MARQRIPRCSPVSRTSRPTRSTRRPIPTNWGFDSVSCSVTSANGGSAPITGASVAIHLEEGENWTCTYLDSLRVGTLQIVKKVTNDNGGTKTVGDFGLASSAGTLVFDAGTLVGSTKTYTAAALTVNAGSYTFDEINVDGYTEGTWSCTGASATGTAFNAGSVTVPNGGAVVCTITNNDQAGTLQIVKKVTNDNGGTKTVGDFGLASSAGTLVFDAGTLVGSTKTYTAAALTVNAGSYTFDEINVDGYTEGTWSCTGASATGTAFNAGSVTVPNGGAVVCTITNNDQAGTLQIVKKVTNDNGGTKTVGDFGLASSAGTLVFDAGTLVGSTKTYTAAALTVNAGSYTFDEINVDGYTEGTWSCTGASATGTAFNAGSVTVPNGGAVVCTITNNDQAGTLQIVKKVTNDNGGTKTVGDFGLASSAGTARLRRRHPGRLDQDLHRRRADGQRRQLHVRRDQRRRLHRGHLELHRRLGDRDGLQRRLGDRAQRRGRRLHDHQQRPGRDPPDRQEGHQRQRRDQDRRRLRPGQLGRDPRLRRRHPRSARPRPTPPPR